MSTTSSPLIPNASQEPATCQGSTTVAELVVAKLVGITAREHEGVYALGSPKAKVLGALKSALGNSNLLQGVTVEVGRTQVAVDVSLVAQYPTPLGQLVIDVRNAIAHAVRDIVGMQVVEVNVNILDVHLAMDESTQNSEDAETPVLTSNPTQEAVPTVDLQKPKAHHPLEESNS